MTDQSVQLMAALSVLTAQLAAATLTGVLSLCTGALYWGVLSDLRVLRWHRRKRAARRAAL